MLSLVPDIERRSLPRFQLPVNSKRSEKPLYVFSAGTVYPHSYRDEILEAYVRFFWMLRARITFLWTIMCGHTELTLLMNFIREWIFAIWTDPRGLRITVLSNAFGWSRKSHFSA
ncbi:hypothetical protein TNCV_3552121 [Trichonephila clavipes]|nr:hypothetical protein TNCV_3552121 [Trichonephila clavipes]